MKLFDLIQQTTIEEVIDHAEDSQPNKIKEKEESLQNTLINRLAIPVKIDNKAEYNEETTVIHTENYGNEPIREVEEPIKIDKKEETIVQIKEKQDNVRLFDIINEGKYLEVLEGSEKAINVKQTMLDNMKQKDIKPLDKYEKTFESEVIVHQPIKETVIEEIRHEEPSLNDKLDFLLKNNQEEKTNNYDIENTIKDASINSTNELPEEIKQQLSGVVDLDATFVEIKETRTKFMDMSKKANLAEQEASDSEKKLREMTSQYTEEEKALENSKRKSHEMEKKILALLNNEKNKLNQQLQEKEVLISDANRRKEQNDSRIVDYQAKINSTREEANEINEKISHQQELLNALGWHSDDENIHDENITRRVA